MRVPNGGDVRIQERGSTFVTELVALAIVGLALLILLSAFSPGSAGVAVVQQRVTAENLARGQMETIKAAPYQANPTTVPYPTVSAPSNYTLDIEVSYWVSPTFTSSVPGVDQGLQWITVTVHSLQREGKAVFSLEDYKGDR